MARPACTQIEHRRALSASLAFRLATDSSPRRPSASARRITIGTATSTQLTSMPSNTSRTRPVGSSRPVLAPTGLRRLSSTPGKAPYTPGISVSAGITGRPPGVRTRQSVTTEVLVLKTRTSVLGSPARSRPWCSRNIGIAADILPQLTLQSIADFSAASWASVLWKSACSPSPGSTMKTLLLVAGPRPSPVICLLPLSSPLSGTPMILRMISSRNSPKGARCDPQRITPVDVPPRM